MAFDSCTIHKLDGCLVESRSCTAVQPHSVVKPETIQNNYKVFAKYKK